MGNWTISYQDLNLGGTAVHGIIVVTNNLGQIVKIFQGLGTDSGGNSVPMVR